MIKVVKGAIEMVGTGTELLTEATIAAARIISEQAEAIVESTGRDKQEVTESLLEHFNIVLSIAVEGIDSIVDDNPKKFDAVKLAEKLLFGKGGGKNEHHS